MIVVHFIYKGSVVEIKQINQPFTQRNCTNVHADIALGKIEKPGNFERFILKDHVVDGLYVG